MDQDIPLDVAGPLPGQFPYRHTQDDRFQYRAKAQPVAGTLEISIRPVDTRLAAMAAQRAFMGYPKRIGPAPETDRDDNVRKAKLRAKGQVKLLAMELGVDRLLTFTIRKVGDCMEYDNVLKAWDYFRRMASRFDTNFAYICAPEIQKNGQFHIHAGVRGFINVRIYTRMWQSALNRVLKRNQGLVAGSDSPGTCNVTKALRGATLQKAKNIARYIAKYIGKSLETGFNRKSHFHTTGIKITPAQAFWLEANDRESAIVEVMQRYGMLESGVGFDVQIWRRDSCSAWFSVPVNPETFPPPF
jgi:hypothetical protein